MGTTFRFFEHIPFLYESTKLDGTLISSLQIGVKIRSIAGDLLIPIDSPGKKSFPKSQLEEFISIASMRRGDMPRGW